MSWENVEIVRQGYERVSAGLEMPPDLFDADVEVDSTDVGAGNFGLIRGLDASLEALRDYWEMFDDFRVELEEVLHADDERVVTAVRDGGRIKGSGAEVRNRFFHVWTLRNRKIVRLSIHTDRVRALEAAGLSDQVVSEENVEIVRQGNDAFNRHDKAAFLAGFDPAAEMIPAREWPEQAPVRGAEAIWGFYSQVTAAWQQGSFEVGETIDAGPEKLVANTRRETRGKASGAAVEFSYWAVFTFRYGKTIRVEWFSNRGEALEAAGLSE